MRDMYESNLEFEEALFAALTREDAPSNLIARVEMRVAAARQNQNLVRPPKFSSLQVEARSLRTNLFSIGAHAVAAALILILLSTSQIHFAKPKDLSVSSVDVKPYIPLTARLGEAIGGGGGGGAHSMVETSKGHLPKIEKAQIAPPQILKLENPRLAVSPAVVMPQQVKLPDANMPEIGLPQSPQAVMSSQGSGSGSGFGAGQGGGLGSGSGSGVGPGSGAGAGSGVYRPGSGVSSPQLLYAPDPEFSDEARRAKYQGVCIVSLIVDSQGRPQNIHVVRSLGMGLDQKAIEAVQQYKFKPSSYQGHPVPVQVNVEVNFRIY